MPTEESCMWQMSRLVVYELELCFETSSRKGVQKKNLPEPRRNFEKSHSVVMKCSLGINKPHDWIVSMHIAGSIIINFKSLVKKACRHGLNNPQLDY